MVRIYVRISAMVTVIVVMRALLTLLIVVRPRHLIRVFAEIIMMDVIAVLANQMVRLFVL